MQKIHGTAEMFDLACNMFRGVRETDNRSWISHLNEAAELTRSKNSDGRDLERAKNMLGWPLVYYVKLLLYQYEGSPGSSFEEWDKKVRVLVKVKKLTSQGAWNICGRVVTGRYIENQLDLPEYYHFNLCAETGVTDEAKVQAIFDEIAYKIFVDNLDLSFDSKAENDDE
jgi:hypothetical protein